MDTTDAETFKFLFFAIGLGAMILVVLASIISAD